MTESTTTSQRSSSMSSLAHPRERRKSRTRSCWFGCIWLSRVSLMGSSASTSSPEPDETISVLERIVNMLGEKPLKMAHMLKVTKYINESSAAEKANLFRAGILHTLLDLIAETAISDNSGQSSRNSSGENKRRGRRNSSASFTHKGIGYGTGSTRSRWDIERTVEEKMLREENLTWLLNAFNAFIISWPIGDALKKKSDEEIEHMDAQTIKIIGDSQIFSILEYNLRNDSFFDVSEHIEIYQSLLETAACMSVIPGLIPRLVKPHQPDAKSIAKELIPKFKENILNIHEKWGGTLEDSDFRLTDFSRKVEFLSNFVIDSARTYESSLPPEQRIRTASQRNAALIEKTYGVGDSEDIIYRNLMKNHQLQTFKFFGDYGKLAVPYTFKKEARNLNPFSPNLRERTKRIAKELASMNSSLPLNASNSIYVCYDEGRCDLLKVLISGPDDTPYANGLFEFDVFFPSNYPVSPPKCAFLTTGAGNVRFNPNLYNDGKICLSILGTWEGRPEEKWNPYCSLMQVLVSIQGLIFVKDPYFNEPGFEKYQGTEKGEDYSRKYNLQIEHATLNYAIKEQLHSSSSHFKEIIRKHCWLRREAILKQAQTWLASVKRDMHEDRAHKRKESINFEMGNPSSPNQEHAIELLITELTNMKSPFEGKYK
ncbi:unnamed protein product [Caenorhabditis angaria]|uniref:UBC core domain-containing protein n=1 Tax=Caenorhabditis angaria TaxID=860376 RepID=A0A9P1IZP2_9PELO|nr:unnamed protein product [Caenorhabditis angaria]